MQNTSPNQLLASTAAWTAGVRAKESERDDHLFFDPWAEALAGEEGMTWIESRPVDSALPIAIRTRYFDDFLQRITRQQAISQVVLLAAGLDTRAYRLSWPEDTIIFELDQPAVLAHKESVLREAGARPTCRRRSAGANLAAPWTDALVEMGFEPRLPAVWLLEGFLFYLPNESITSILDTVTSLSAAGSWVGFDIINSTMLTSPITAKWIAMQAQSGAPWIGTMDDPRAFMARRGWETALMQAGAENANYGRWRLPVFPVLQPDVPHNWYVTARTQAGS